jgi:hypothetical protein
MVLSCKADRRKYKMSKIIEFKKINQDRLKRQYELEDCDEELIELAEKLIQCNPAKSAAKKKEEVKAEYLKKAREYRKTDDPPRELSDEELDAAAGGVIEITNDIKDPLKD